MFPERIHLGGTFPKRRTKAHTEPKRGDVDNRSTIRIYWNVYRRYSSFVELSRQVKSLYPDTLDVPVLDGESLNCEVLDNSRQHLDKWLRTVIENVMILRTQSMYQFLCADANVPPPYLEIHWRNSENGSFDEMVKVIKLKNFFVCASTRLITYSLYYFHVFLQHNKGHGRHV